MTGLVRINKRETSQEKVLVYEEIGSKGYPDKNHIRSDHEKTSRRFGEMYGL